MANKTREPLVHISRRSTLPWYQSWGIRACALILSLGVCALVTMFTTGENPLSVFGAIYDASFSSQRRTWVLFQNIAMLLSVSLAVVPAFKMRFWNLGGEGQMLAGALATTACMICLRDALPNGALIPVMIVCSIAAGALWGFVPAFFKAKWGTNETLFTLMMNYIAIHCLGDAQRRRSDRHYQPEYGDRLAAGGRGAEIPAEYYRCRGPDGIHVHLYEIFQTRI